ncbi:MAG: ATP-dependent helicase HrpB [Planctomycetales bacterium]
MALTPLPIDAVLPDLLAVLRQQTGVVLQAPTGAGKTTRVPPALLPAELSGTGKILLLEPRRLAARAAAYRMAEERGEKIGQTIGYQVRFDRQIGPDTRIEVLTEGILVRRMQQDPFLEDVSVILFDEFHERSLETDLSLAMARRVQQTVRPDLKLIVMSATLVPEKIAPFLGNVPVVRSEGRLFPVEIRHWPAADKLSVLERAVVAVKEVTSQATGDLLVFLPGTGEIRRVRSDLEEWASAHNIALYGLSGDLSPEEQHAVLLPGSRRKVILATNVAETSVTIEGVTAVIDTGLARIMHFDAGTGLNRLTLSRISKASAAQRSGRAGRTAPGLCRRLWTAREERGLPAETPPEIERVDLTGTLLELLCWGEQDLMAFPWYEAPPSSAIQQGLELLTRLGAVETGALTPLGERMAKLPVHPRLARLLIEAAEAGDPELATWGAALLEEREPFSRKPTPWNRPETRRSDSDLLDRIHAVQEFLHRHRRETPWGTIQPGAARQIQRAQQHLHKSLKTLFRNGSFGSPSPEVALMKGILAAFPDRVALRRQPLGRKGIMVGGKGVELAPQSAVLEGDLFVCLEVDAGTGEAVVRQASRIERAWLPQKLISTEQHLEFDAASRKIIARKRTLYLDLILDETPAPVPEDERTAETLAAAAWDLRAEALNWEKPEIKNFLARVRSLREWRPELSFPAFDDEFLRQQLPNFCYAARSFADLQKRSVTEWLKGLLTYSQRQTLDQEAPEKLPVPSGSQITLQYEEGRPPVLAVRIQELFGLAETPRLAQGRVPVLLHLLAPNYRPQQITNDLQSFWNTTYQQVRKELRARYPRHSWPEDPWTAEAQRRPRRRTS